MIYDILKLSLLFIIINLHILYYFLFNLTEYYIKKLKNYFIIISLIWIELLILKQVFSPIR